MSGFLPDRPRLRSRLFQRRPQAIICRHCRRILEIDPVDRRLASALRRGRHDIGPLLEQPSCPTELPLRETGYPLQDLVRDEGDPRSPGAPVLTAAACLWTLLAVITVLDPSPGTPINRTINAKKIKVPFTVELGTLGFGVVLLALYAYAIA